MGVSLQTGWLPWLLIGLAVAAALYLLIRPLRWWWRWFVPGVVLVAAVLTWVIAKFFSVQLFADELQFDVAIWVAVIIAAVLLAIGHLFASPWWEKVLAVLAAVCLVAGAGNQINKHFQQYPRLSDLLGVASDQQINGPPPISPDSSTPVKPTGPLTQTWTPTGANIPADGKGKVSTITIPTPNSGITTRQGQVYYPPAYFADNPQPLPVLVLLTGQPGDPTDWFNGDRLATVMNDFAAAHHGIAPIVVSPDPNGSQLANTLCMNSNLGQADTYMSQDVPAAIKQQLRVQTDPRSWAIAGMSWGGTCALQQALYHPDIYPTFLDVSGEQEPTTDNSHQDTVAAAFAGDETKWKAVNPIDILATKKFPNTAGYFAVGSEDAAYIAEQKVMFAAAQKNGMDVQYWESPGTSHDWDTASNSLAHAMPWLAQRLNLTS